MGSFGIKIVQRVYIERVPERLELSCGISDLKEPLHLMADEVSFFPWCIFMGSFILIVKHLSVSTLLGTGQTSEQDLIPSVLK